MTRTEAIQAALNGKKVRPIKTTLVFWYDEKETYPWWEKNEHGFNQHWDWDWCYHKWEEVSE